MDTDYEGQAYDVRAKRRVPFESQGRGFVVPVDEAFDLDRHEIQQAVEAILENFSFGPPPENEAEFGDVERFDATVAAAQRIIAQNKVERVEKELESVKAHSPRDDIQIASLEFELDSALETAKAAAATAHKKLREYRRAMNLREHRMRLGNLVESSRSALGLTQAEFAVRVGVSTSTIQTLENSDNPHKGVSVKTVTGIENALGWEAGSVQAILNGGDPVSAKTGAVIGSSTTSGSAVGEAIGSDSEPGSRFTVRLPDDLADDLRFQAVKEDRTVNRVIESALRLYLKTMADD